ncbi:tyrosine-type recombinase/integrase [Megasphaera paucivorans]|uniref:Site-specific recombinase XerD n=1 Tax=Megasphaera paucivorans TaxID=349095 RepID=A0A1G9WY47_9FIRM|nr:tyrosine-type recombinase/integrase [Megasphaera paucivorans]SDM89015.1 Site-specific recombinase XerD [Megasphaera paucivorans]
MTGTLRRKKGGREKYWILTIDMGRDRLGHQQRRQKTVFAANKADAQDQLTSWMEELRMLIPATQQTVSVFSEEWIVQYSVKQRLAPRTIDSYRRLLETHIKPNIGSLKMVDVTPIILEKLFTDLSNQRKAVKQRRSADKTLSPRTVRGIYFLVSRIFRTAFRLGQIPNNPMEKIDAPKGGSKRPQIFDQDTVNQIFSVLFSEDSVFQMIVLLAATTGCREGEILGLSWNDYDPTQQTFFVHQTAQYTVEKGTYIWPHTKTENSKRYIYIIPQLLSMIEAAKTEFDNIKNVGGDGWNNLNLIFYTPEGGPVRPNYISNKFTKFIRRHGIRHFRFHDLRGYFATQLMIQGFSLPDIIQRTGHSKASTLLDYYGHAMTNNQSRMNKAITTSYEKLEKKSDG